MKKLYTSKPNTPAVPSHRSFRRFIRKMFASFLKRQSCNHQVEIQKITAMLQDIGAFCRLVLTSSLSPRIQGRRNKVGIFHPCAGCVFSGSIGPITGFSMDSAFPRMKNGFLASIMSFLSFKIRFDPIVARIVFLVLVSPLLNRS